jgi:hypothetical protein
MKMDGFTTVMDESFGFFFGGLNPDTSIEGIFAKGKLTTRRPGGLLGINIGRRTSDSGMMPCDSRNSGKRRDYGHKPRNELYLCLPRDLYLNTNDTYVLAVLAPGTSGACGFIDHVVEYCT